MGIWLAVYPPNSLYKLLFLISKYQPHTRQGPCRGPTKKVDVTTHQWTMNLVNTAGQNLHCPGRRNSRKRVGFAHGVVFNSA
jgi:hypothetical protein